MMTPYVVTRYYRAPEVILGMGYKENGGSSWKPCVVEGPTLLSVYGSIYTILGSGNANASVIFCNAVGLCKMYYKHENFTKQVIVIIALTVCNSTYFPLEVKNGSPNSNFIITDPTLYPGML